MSARRPAGRTRRRLGALGFVLVAVAALAVGWGLVHREMPGWYARMWYPLEHEDTIRAQAARNELPPEVVAAVIQVESGFVPDSRSPQGAVGLMQVLPSTAEWLARQPRRPSPSPRDLENPETNIAYGSHLLGDLRRRFGSIPLALVAYNAGDGNLRRWRREARASGRPFRVPADVPFSETREYVSRVLDTASIYRRAYGEELSGAS